MAESPVCPESTIESANRRNFIKKAALASVAVGLAGTVLAGNPTPESSASSANTVSGCYVVANVDVCSAGDIFAAKSLIADYASTNNGTSLRPGLVFGGPPCKCTSGEGISSNQTDCCCINPHGLDFYTESKKRMLIANNGNVAIGAANPASARLSVAGCGYPGIYACASETAITGSSSNAHGVVGLGTGSGSVGVYGSAPYIGVIGAADKIGVEAQAACKAGIALIAKGTFSQTGHLQEWRNSSCGILAVVNACGYFGINNPNPERRLCITGRIQASCGVGIGTQTINTTLAVNGSFAAKTRSVTTGQTLATTDFAILASGNITLTLPKANTQNGMMLVIKKTDSSATTVTIKPQVGDTIEGTTSTSTTPRTLSTQYSGYTLLSNGSNEWFIIGTGS